ncbi:cytochrome P450 [Sandarakinorhabdus sp. AAP62]|uniref:cytochrome P450 n=1 Tax=Sandarakinorhabdus sp. AAP62 TaxID=1248916 RepID=UPI0002F837D7|nr:cytochrome P450 [Sandarakinorhabdus sp. AAP62]
MSIPTGLQVTIFDEIFRNRPHERFDALREADPVHEDKVLGRVLLTRAADVAATLKDRSLSVDQRNAAPDTIVQRLATMQDREAPRSMLVLDDPEHGRLRRLVTHAFNARAIEAVKPQVVAVADELLDAVVEQDRFDLIEDFASPLPITVIAAMLGVDVADRGDFRRWSKGLANVFSPIRSPEFLAALQANSDEISAYFERVIGERRTAPRDDLISALIAAEDGGDRLTTQEIVTMCILLLLAGNLTTTDLIGNCVLALLRHPEQRATVQANPARIADAIEETLRLDPPVVQSLRIPLEPREIGGCPVRAGEAVTTFLMAAGQDPALHKDPLTFDIDRADKTHFAFGGGVHFCLGAPLARAEAEIALTRLFARFPNLALTGDPIERNISAAFNGVQQLWVRP